MKLQDLPNGTVISYRKKLYWVSEGLDARIVTGTDGQWQFIRDLKWQSFKVVFSP